MRLPCCIGGHRFTRVLVERIAITVVMDDEAGRLRERHVQIRQCDRCPKLKVGGFYFPPFRNPSGPPSGKVPRPAEWPDPPREALPVIPQPQPARRR